MVFPHSNIILVLNAMPWAGDRVVVMNIQIHMRKPVNVTNWVHYCIASIVVAWCLSRSNAQTTIISITVSKVRCRPSIHTPSANRMVLRRYLVLLYGLTFYLHCHVSYFLLLDRDEIYHMQRYGSRAAVAVMY